MDDLQALAWLTKNKLTQFTVSGTVELGNGRLRFTVDGGAASGDQARWIAELAGQQSLAHVIENGQAVTVLDTDIAVAKISFPRSMWGAGFQVAGDNGNWVIWLAYPAFGRSLIGTFLPAWDEWRAVRHFRATRGAVQPWRDALTA